MMRGRMSGRSIVAGIAALLVLHGSGCVGTRPSGPPPSRVEAVDMEAVAVDREAVERRRRRDGLKNLANEMQAVRGYLLEAEDAVRQMQDEAALLLNEYRAGIGATHASHAGALRGQPLPLTVSGDSEMPVSALEGRVQRMPENPARVEDAGTEKAPR
jgi:hypothetical protein